MKRFHNQKRRGALAAVAVTGLLALGTLSACSGSGGKKAEEEQSQAAAGGAAAGPRLKIAMITHSGAGDTFWDIVQKGAKAAAAKDNVQFLYSADPEGGKQAQLVQAAIDQKVDGIIVTLAKPDALKDVVGRAVQAKIPVVTINSGAEESAEFGALVHFGQDETIAGQAAGEQLNKIGAKKAICVIHEQGNVSLEARCAGVKKTFKGTVENLNVEGTNMPASTSSIEAKLQSAKDIDAVVTLGAPFAAASVKAKEGAGSSAEVNTFDLNAEVVKQLKAGEIGFAVDQQPYLQGYLAIDELWLNKTNGNVIGGGKPILTGPALVTEKDVPALEKLTADGTR
jgi:simple sugar transport system substrate-binding protein